MIEFGPVCSHGEMGGPSDGHVATETEARMIRANLVARGCPADIAERVEKRALGQVVEPPARSTSTDYDGAQLRRLAEQSKEIKTGDLWDRTNAVLEHGRIERAARQALEIRDDDGIFGTTGWQKSEVVQAVQDTLDDEYGESAYRTVDVCPADSDQRSRCTRAVAIARALNTDDEAFDAFDFELEPADSDDEDERALKSHVEVSSIRCRLMSRARRVQPSGTVWQSSVRAHAAKQEHAQRVADRALKARMGSEAGRVN